MSTFPFTLFPTRSKAPRLGAAMEENGATAKKRHFESPPGAGGESPIAAGDAGPADADAHADARAASPAAAWDSPPLPLPPSLPVL